jgi:2-C-methyl-D-erythritol 4-phosphate cytidylyltransferase
MLTDRVGSAFMRTVAVVLAGGSGSRFDSANLKQLRVLAGRNLIEHCVLAFDQAPAIDAVVVVATADTSAQVRQDLAAYRKVADVITGGATRTDSTRAALGWLRARLPADAKVLFHDAARPLVDQRTIADCVAALDRFDAIGVVVPSSDTIVEVTDGLMQRVLPRHTLARCQTPQGFRLSVIAGAYERADADPAFATIPATDDCGVVQRYLPGVPIAAVEGNERNIKITYAADLAVAAALLDAADKPGETRTS